MKSISFLPLAVLVVLANAACSGTSQDSNADSSSDDLKSRKVVEKLNVVNLTSDGTVVSGGAANQDPNLLNAWGVAFNSKGGAWISDNHSGKTTVYDATGKLELTVDLPGAGGAASAPTGQVLNEDTTAFGGDLFMFASEDGTISAWQPKPGASVKIDNSKSDANYKGITMAKAASGERLYVTNFRNGTMEVYDSNYAPVTVAGGFKDNQIDAGYSPFNVRAFKDLLIVTYAKTGPRRRRRRQRIGPRFRERIRPRRKSRRTFDRARPAQLTLGHRNRARVVRQNRRRSFDRKLRRRSRERIRDRTRRGRKSFDEGRRRAR